MWGEKQGIFGEKTLQKGWNQNPIQAIINTGEKNIFIMHGNGGGARLASLYRHIILRERKKLKSKSFFSLIDNESLDSAC